MTRVLRLSLTIVLTTVWSTTVFAQARGNVGFGTISGTVLTREGTPAAGLRVGTTPVDGNVTGINTVLQTISQTDDAGRFTLTNVRAGRYFVVAGRMDMPTYYPGVAEMNGATMVTVNADQTVTGIDFSMQTALGLRFAGRVIRQDSEGNVLPAAPAGAASPPFQAALGYAVTAVVRLAPTSGNPFTFGGEGTVAPDGTFQFNNLAPGTYQLTMIPVVNVQQRISVTLTDRDITDYQFIVPLVVTVPGTITMEGGGPIPRVQMEFVDVSVRPPTAPASTLPAGPTRVSPQPTFTAQVRAGDQRINLTGIPPGYVLKSMTSGGVDLTRNPFKVGPNTPPLQIVFGASTPSPWVRAAGRVEGRGEWHVLVNFNVNHPQVGSPLEPIFYLDGSFEFPMTLPGDIQVRTNAIGGATLMSVVTARPGGTDNAVIHVPSTSPSTIGTQPNGEMQGVRVGGRVVGKAIATRGARVLLRHATVGETFNAPVYMDGSFEFPRVPPGSYAAEVYPPVPGAGPTVVTVGDADLRGLRVTVPDTRNFNGRVLMEGNGPLPRMLSFSPGAGAPVSAKVRPDGSFQVELPLGQRIGLASSSTPRGQSLAAITHGAVDLLSSPLAASTSVVDELRLTFRSVTPAVRVSGRMGGSAALPAGAIVWLVDAAGVYQTLESVVASDRTFTFPAVTSGTYTARLSAPGAPASNPSAPVVVAGSNVESIEIVP